MAEAGCRILVLQSSSVAAEKVKNTLSEAGWEIWPGRSVQDALLLSAGLRFDVVVSEESCAKAHPDLWRQLEDALPEALWIIHRDHSKKRNHRTKETPPIGVLGQDSEVLLAIILLALEGGRERSRASAA